MLRRHNGGFSIVEVVTVIAIITGITGIALVSLRDIASHSSALQEGQALIRVLQDARSLAKRTKELVQIIPEQNGLKWKRASATDEESERVQFAEAVSWKNGTPPSFSFNGVGLVRGLQGDEVDLTLTSAGHLQKIILNVNGFIQRGDLSSAQEQ